MKREHTLKEIIPMQIVGPDCGRNSQGNFICVCGMCHPKIKDEQEAQAFEQEFTDKWEKSRRYGLYGVSDEEIDNLFKMLYDQRYNATEKKKQALIDTVLFFIGAVLVHYICNLLF